MGHRNSGTFKMLAQDGIYPILLQKGVDCLSYPSVKYIRHLGKRVISLIYEGKPEFCSSLNHRAIKQLCVCVCVCVENLGN